MTKDILIQYCDLKEEAKDLRRRIEKLESDINRIEKDGCVADSVTGGAGGIQHFTIKGFPYPEYSRKKTRLYLNKAQLESAEQEYLEVTNAVEDYIQSIEDSRIRRIMRYIYIDDLTYIQAAHKMGGKATADSIRMELNRFMDRQ